MPGGAICIKKSSWLINGDAVFVSGIKVTLFDLLNFIIKSVHLSGDVAITHTEQNW